MSQNPDMLESSWTERTREWLLSYLVNYFNHGYKFIKIKANPTSEEK